jgi:hypothetical protein
LLRDELISATVSPLRAHIVVGTLRATSEATVVPHDPPPRMLARSLIRHHLAMAGLRRP